jgi:hypothetical protein
MEDSKKKIIFTVSARQKADFKIRLQYDGLTQAHFFRAVMEGYVGKDENLMAYLNSFKKQNKVQNNQQRSRIDKDIQASKQTKNLFALDDDEVENIFDILEQEHPEL